MIIIGFLTVAFLLALTTVVFVVIRLLRFDSVWDVLDARLDAYQTFLEERTSKGILTDHPEVREFHKRTVEMRDAMRAVRASIGSVRGKGVGEWDSTSAETSTRTSSSSVRS